jgi:anthranilate phosphoribosyltransferase
MKHAVGPRREIGIRTVFNILGPLTNPAGARYHLLGVFDQDLTASLAVVLKNMGSSRAMVVHGCDGLDEITLTQDTQVTELKDGQVRTFLVMPEDVGLQRCAPTDLMGGDPMDNARIALDVLQGSKGPKRDIVLFNAGAAIYLAGMVPTLEMGVRRAEESIDNGKAMQKLELLKDATKKDS